MHIEIITNGDRIDFCKGEKMTIEDVFEKYRGSLMKISRVVGAALIEVEDKKVIAVFVWKDQWWDDVIKNIPRTLDVYDIRIFPTHRIQAIGTGNLLGA